MAKVMQKLCELRRSHTDENATRTPASPRVGGAVCDRRLRLRITIAPADGEGRPEDDCQSSTRSDAGLQYGEPSNGCLVRKKKRKKRSEGVE